MMGRGGPAGMKEPGGGNAPGCHRDDARLPAGRITAVPVADVLEAAGAGAAAPAAEAAPPPRDPRADPVTGALWAGPPGSLPPHEPG